MSIAARCSCDTSLLVGVHTLPRSEGLGYLFQRYAAADGLWSDNHLREGVMDPQETRINGPNVYRAITLDS